MKKLEEIMMDYGISDSELARHLGLSRQAVRRSRLEGLKERVSLFRYAKGLSKLIGIEIEPVDLRDNRAIKHLPKEHLIKVCFFSKYFGDYTDYMIPVEKLNDSDIIGVHNGLAIIDEVKDKPIDLKG